MESTNFKKILIIISISMGSINSFFSSSDKNGGLTQDQSDLFRWCALGNLDKIKQLIQSGVSPKVTNPKKLLLNEVDHIITRSGDYGDVDVPHTCKNRICANQTPLHCISYIISDDYYNVTDLEKIIRYLIYSKANIGAQDINGDTPLHIAARFGRDKIVKLLLKYNASITIQNKKSLLH